MSFIKIESNSEWQKIFESCKFKTFFNDPEWEQEIQKVYKHINFEHYLYKNKLALNLAKVGNKYISFPFCEYGGPMILDNDVNWEEFKKNAQQKFSNLKIKFHPFILTGKSEQGLSSYWLENLNQKNEQKIFAGFRKTLRHSIKKAEKQNLKLVSCSEQDLPAFYDIYLQNCKKNKALAFPLEFFQAWVKLAEKNKLKFILAKHNNKVVAGSIFLNYSGFVHYFLNASDYDYRNLNANYLIVWDEIKSIINNKNATVLDFGATIPGSNLEIFKRGWGTTEKKILEIPEHQTNNLNFLRSTWALMPKAMIKILSKIIYPKFI